MSSSTSAVLRGTASTGVAAISMPELRGDGLLLDDETTQRVLGPLAERARSAARAQGYAAGWAEGRRAAETAAQLRAETVAHEAAADAARRDAEHAAALTALRQVAERLEERWADACRSVDEQASDLALELTRELVGHSAYADGEHAVQRVLGVLPDQPVVRVRLHPDVATDAGDALREREVAVVADGTLGRADAVVETDDHVLDLRVDTALARLREALS